MTGAFVAGAVCALSPSTAAAQVPPYVNGRIELSGPNPRGASVPLRSFVAEVEADDAGGECISSSPFGPTSMLIVATFPSRSAAVMNAVLTFDATGALIHYNETRGFTGARGVSPRATAAERDSARVAQSAAMRSTAISLDYTSGVASLRNFGGGKPSVVATAAVAVVEAMPQFGPINERVARVRKLCGV
ncbi:MAG TPA: hypothetical protein VGQ30_08960 [Gemmatimonadaceae bacterium]|jgi:hypothetical protein|nr:hypothetical protein [Gemmatimonadaceae bacterium]